MSTITQGATEDAIRHHYDIGDAFYRLWLDPTMTYTCALWEGDDDGLEAAQLRKLDYYLDAAKPRGLRRVLDVGCGWGSLLRRAVERHGAEHAAGVTVSEAQWRYLRAHADARQSVHLQPWQEHRADEPYDAVFSICAIEHFARPGLSRAERVKIYRDFFGHVHGLTKPGGTFGLQSICWGTRRPDDAMLEHLFFLSTEIFPESEWPRFAELAHAAERLFEIESVRNDREHYVRTLACWREGLGRTRDEAVACVGEEVVRRYERYLDFTQTMFADDVTGLLRIVMRRRP